MTGNSFRPPAACDPCFHDDCSHFCHRCQETVLSQHKEVAQNKGFENSDLPPQKMYSGPHFKNLSFLFLAIIT